MQSDRSERIALAGVGIFRPTIAQIEGMRAKALRKAATDLLIARLNRSNARWDKAIAQATMTNEANLKRIRTDYTEPALSFMLEREAKYNRLRIDLARGDAARRFANARKAFEQDNRRIDKALRASLRLRTGK